MGPTLRCRIMGGWSGREIVQMTETSPTESHVPDCACSVTMGWQGHLVRHNGDKFRAVLTNRELRR